MVIGLSRQFGLLAEDESAEEGLLAAVWQGERAGGLAGNLRQLARVAYSLRDRLSADNWRTLNRLSQEGGPERPRGLLETLSWVDRSITGLVTLSGYAFDGMTRDTGWRFLSLGRRLERLSFIALALQTALRQGRRAGLGWLLELTDSSITYRTRFPSSPEWLPVLDLIVRDQANPRALHYLADGIVDFLGRLQAQFGPFGVERMSQALAQLRALDINNDLDPDSEVLARTIDRLRQCAFETSDAITARFFTQVPVTRPTPLAV